MNILDLDTILAKTSETYSHVAAKSPSGVEFKLLNALQLPKEKRDELTAVNEDLSAEGADQAEAIRKALRVVTDNAEALEEILSAVGDNLAALVTMFRAYNEGTQAGEA